MAKPSRSPTSRARRSRIVGPLRGFAKPLSRKARVGSNPTSSALRGFDLSSAEVQIQCEPG